MENKVDERIIAEEKEFLINKWGKKIIESDERYDTTNGYYILAHKYLEDEFKDDGVKREIHHIDFNHYNNVLSNIVVLTVSEHRKIHMMFDPEYLIKRKNCLGQQGVPLPKKVKENISKTMKETGIRAGKNNPMFGKRAGNAGKKRVIDENGRYHYVDKSCS